MSRSPLDGDPLVVRRSPMPPAAYRGREYLDLPTEPETWLVKPLIPAGGSIVVYGEAKVGKSYAALQLAQAIQDGGDWLGFPVCKTGPVIYVQLDTPRGLWIARLKDLKTSGVTAVDEIIFADRETLNTMPFNILNQDHFHLLTSTIAQFQPVAVVVDTLREAHPADENDSTDMRNVTAALQAACFPAAMILITHERKPDKEGGLSLISDVRGSNYVVGRMDAILRFTKARLYYTGRSIEEGHISLHRQDNGFWTSAQQDLDTAVSLVMADPRSTSIREKAKVLAAKTGKTEEACRSLLRRAQHAGGPDRAGRGGAVTVDTTTQSSSPGQSSRADVLPEPDDNPDGSRKASPSK